MAWVDSMTPRRAWALAAIAGALAVLFGAFGSHALSSRLEPGALEVWRTGVTYQFYHVLALFMVGSFLHLGIGARQVRLAGWMFSAGIVVFCGSLYLLALTGVRGFGAITPLGGAALVVGWLLLTMAAWRRNRH